ncbi:MAG TPA: hypothetical protein VFX89_12185 [Gammaproteobacteria bacterium]|nr:hypothetical protein [Gammaproteobacteria bacterium]
MWRDHKTLVMLHEADLPDRCVKCNDPADLPSKPRRVYWHHWAIYLVLLLNILIYAIVALIVRKKAVVAPGLCTRHKRRRAIALSIGWIGIAGAFALMFLGISDSTNPAFAMLGIILLLFALLELVIAARIVYASRIDADYVYLKGCKPIFLDSLPQFPG